MSEGLRYNNGKLRMDLIPPYFIEEIAKVLTHGAEKYDDNNWQKGMATSVYDASGERHILADRKGEMKDDESGLNHTSHAAVNMLMKGWTAENLPWCDNSPQRWKNDLKVGLDIDGVIADFGEAYKRWFNLSDEIHHWFFTYHARDHWDVIKDDKDFWMSVKPLINGKDIPFEPNAYVTSRPIPVEWVEEWLDKNNFPCEKVVVLGEKSVGKSISKASSIIELGLDFFIEDNFENFTDLQNNGIKTFLIDAPANRKHNVRGWRIKSLTEFYERFLR